MRVNKHTYVGVKKDLESEGYTLLDDKYINGAVKLSCVCSLGHEYKITYYNWRSGYRCKKCHYIKRRVSIGNIKDALKKEGYKLITDKYINNKQRLDCICNRGHLCSITWAGWSSRGDRCNKCGYESMSIKQIGQHNHQWKGGIARLPYCYSWQDKEYKEYIKSRDHNICQNIICSNTDDLVIHHVDYNKKNCSKENLITLCRSCNTKVNSNRCWNSELFKILLNKRLGYLYKD